MNQHREHSETELEEELRNAISNYKQTIMQAEKKKIKHYNTMYKEKMMKNVNSRQEDKLASAYNLITAQITSVNLLNFYEDLKKISKVYEVSLNIVPTLFLPHPASYFFTNSKGILQISESPDSFIKFFDHLKPNSKNYVFPACILKRKNKKNLLFDTANQAKNYLIRKPHTVGIIQEYIHTNTDKISVAKVLWKNNKFKYNLITNKKKVLKNTRSQSLENKKIEIPDLMSYMKKRKETISNISKENEGHNSGILKHILGKVNHPWKEKKNESLFMPPQHANKFIVNGQSFMYSHTNPINAKYPEIENSITTIFFLIKKFILTEKYEITEIACEFLKSSSKKWYFLDCPQMKLKSVDYKEIAYKLNENLISTTKADSDSDGISNMTQIIDESFNEKDIVRPVSHGQSFKSQLSFKAELESSFHDKFRKTLTKIDRIRKKERFNANIGLKYELVQWYKDIMSIDRNGSVPSLIISHSNSKPFSRTIIEPNNPKIANSAELENKLLSTSKHYEIVGAKDIITKHCKESIEEYEKITKNVERLKVYSMKLDVKYGGDKFFLVFNREFFKRAQNTVLSKYCCEKNDEGVICPGINLIFNCVANISLAKRLFETHSKLLINKEEYEVFKEIFINTIKEEFYFDEKDFEYLTGLIAKLGKDIIIRKARPTIIG